MDTLKPDWLAVEVESVDSEFDRMSDGLKASFQSYAEDDDALDATSTYQECSRELVKQLI